MSEQRKELLDRCLDVALANRRFEIQLLWQRTIVFWGFVLALFAGVASIIDKHPRLAAVLALTGVMFSTLWTLVNRGSRSWQESWEEKAADYMQRRYGYGGLAGTLFYRRMNPNPAFGLWRGRRYSVSGLLVALSDLVLLFWLALSLHLFRSRRSAPVVPAGLTRTRTCARSWVSGTSPSSTSS